MLIKSDFNVTEAIRFFNANSIDATYLVPTPTGINKAIMDATAPLQSYVAKNDIHQYEGQLQGPQGKKIVDAFFVTDKELIPTKASLYRPEAKGKSGDPRIWFSKLPHYASAYNLLGVVAWNRTLYVINLSESKIRNSVERIGSPIHSLFKQIQVNQNSISDELIEKLKGISQRGWIKTITDGDTGIGATLEHCLGIQINSSRKPDYKGIEIKTKRLQGLKATTRTSLFAQVPNWQISALKSSAEILDTYGYYRDQIKKLYCTVNATKINSQGLTLVVDEINDLLQERHQSQQGFQDVVSWKLETLKTRLLDKHNETFWIGANTEKINGIEHFHYRKVIHTKRPFPHHFQTLLQEGVITLDHLIKRNASGRVSEKGPLFKIDESNLSLLFPPPLEIDITGAVN